MSATTVAEQPDPAERRRHRKLATVMVVSYLVLIPATVLVRRNAIEGTLTQKVQAALKHPQVNLGGLSVEADGRDIRLSGSVATEQQRQDAIRYAKGRRGVREVDASRLLVGNGGAGASGVTPRADAGQPPAPATPLTRATKVRAVIAGATVTVEAVVSNAEVKARLLGPAQSTLAPDALVDRVTIDPGDGASNLDAHANVGVFLLSLLISNVNDAEFLYDNGSLFLRAKVPNAEEQATIRGYAEQLVGEPGKMTTDFVIDDSPVSTSPNADGPTTTSPAAANASTTVAGVTTTVATETTTTTVVAQITPELIEAAESAIDANLAGKVITFEKESAQLDADGRAVIDSLAAAIKSIPSTAIRFEVNGYTDARGSDVGNQRLSQRRASAVRERLINRGIAANRIAARGFGEADPVADNATEEGRAQNRRIEIRPVVPPEFAATTSVPA